METIIKPPKVEFIDKSEYFDLLEEPMRSKLLNISEVLKENYTVVYVGHVDSDLQSGVKKLADKVNAACKQYTPIMSFNHPIYYSTGGDLVFMHYITLESSVAEQYLKDKSVIS